jgi:hypothetical protein
MALIGAVFLVTTYFLFALILPTCIAFIGQDSARMESLEIGMPWQSSASTSRLTSNSAELRLAAPQSTDASTTVIDPQASPPRAVSSADTSNNDDGRWAGDEIVAVLAIPDEASALEKKIAQGVELDVQGVNGSKKRKRHQNEIDSQLARFGPPRQSVRARIKMESANFAKIDSQQAIVKIKKRKTTERIIAVEDNMGEKTKEDKVKVKVKKKAKGKDKCGEDRRFTEKDTKLVTPPRTSKTAGDAVAYQPGSLEAMGDTPQTTSIRGLTLEERLEGRKRKIKPKKRAKDEVDLDLILLVAIPSIDPVTSRSGIRASTFARVMRLVADLPPLEIKSKREKRRVPDHRPPVWAQVRKSSLLS